MSQLPGDSRGKRMIASGISFLSAEKEAGPFMLYLLGESIESVADKTQYPRDVIHATAEHYRWAEKRDALVQTGKEAELIKDMEKNLLNMMLLATYKLFTTEIGEVMAGKKLPQDCKFVPSSMQGLQKLLEMVEKANKLVSTEKPDAQPGQTVVNAHNVQIINQTTPQTPEERRLAFLKQVAESQK